MPERVQDDRNQSRAVCNVHGITSKAVGPRVADGEFAWTYIHGGLAALFIKSTRFRSQARSQAGAREAED